jgi:lipoate---protein ligase
LSNFDLPLNVRRLVQTKATESVRSKVLNVSEKRPDVTHAGLVSALTKQFAEQFHPDAGVLELSTSDLLSIDGVHSRMTELGSWDHIFGSTPEFSHTTSSQFSWGHVELKIQCYKGKITACDIYGPPEAVDVLIILKAAIEGSSYRASAIIERIEAQTLVSPLSSSKDRGILKDLVTWVAHSIVH